MEVFQSQNFALISAATGIVVWAFSTFATIKYVDEKHEEIKAELGDIKKILGRIEDKLWELKKGE